MSPRGRVAVMVLVVLAASLLVAGWGRPSPSAASDVSAHGLEIAGPPAFASPPDTVRQEDVLDAASRRMRSGKAGQDDPGPADVIDYGIDKLWSRGVDGAGTTIAILVAWDNPATVSHAVARLDSRLGLPSPQIKTILPAGDQSLPAACPVAVTTQDEGCARWDVEADLDVVSAHLMAPYARILVDVVPPDSNSPGEVAALGNPEFMRAAEQISRHHLADVISTSDFSGEATLKYGRADVTGMSPGELSAAAAGIPLVTITGDCGAGDCVTHRRDAAVFADSPWTLAVGGCTLRRAELQHPRGLRPVGVGRGSQSRLHLGLFPFSGAGFSSVFARPRYQSGVASRTHSSRRSAPDITMDGLRGTSEAAPLMAGVLALATQENGGHDLGPINTALYDRLGPRGAADGISDIVRGNDSFDGVRGFDAHSGFDVASGWGTIDAARFVPALVQATRASHDEQVVRARAASALAALSQAIHLSPASVTNGATSQLTATGFLPRFPVTLSIDGRPVTTLLADRHGDITYAIDPTQLHLAAGMHSVALDSMLINMTGQLTVG